MKRNILSLIMVAITLAFFMSCSSSEGTEGSGDATDATKTGTEVTSDTPPPTPPAEGTPDPDLPKTTMEFAEMTHDFGDIQEGEKVSHTFTFKNTGDEPLVISSAKGSCGCTVPQWPKEPIEPGGEGEMLVEYNSKGKGGKKETKTVTVQANTDPNPTRLTIKANVIADPNKESTDASSEPKIELKQN